jgi:hypothetical protein
VVLVNRLSLAALISLAGCARILDETCFFDEPCAVDGGRTGGGAAGGGATGGGMNGGGAGGNGGGVTGGGMTGGGMTGGGGGMTGGGVTGGGVTGGGVTGGGMTGGGMTSGGRTAVPFLGSSAGVVFDEAGLLPGPPIAAQPQYTPELVALPVLLRACGEGFSGALNVMTQSGSQRTVVLIPRCYRALVELDVLGGTSRVLTPLLFPPSTTGLFGGAIFGCDLRGYALPDDGLSVLRFTTREDGGADIAYLSIGTQPLRLKGGVLARPCAGGTAMRVVAAGQGGLYVLDIWEDGIDVSPVTTPNTAGVQFEGVARLGDRFVVSNFAPLSGNRRISLTVDALTATVVNETIESSTDVSRGVATAGGAFTVTETGTLHTLPPDGGAPRTLATSSARWPVNGLNGWLLAAGSKLIAFDTQTANAGVVLDPLPGGATAAGLLAAPDGVLVLVPGGIDAGVVVLRPAVDPGVTNGTYFAPWFNKR